MTPATATEPTRAAPPPVKHCAACGERIYWAINEEGVFIPVDAAPVERGTIELSKRPGDWRIHARVLTRAEADAATLAVIDAGLNPRLRTNHFATCPRSARSRRRRS